MALEQEAQIISDNVGVVNLRRKNGEVELTIKLAPEIENLFSNITSGVTNTDKNKHFNLEWYPVPLTTNKFERFARRYYLSLPHKELDTDRQFNFTFLFAKGTSKGVTFKFTDLTSIDQLQQYSRELTNLIREIYNEYIAEISIENKMTLRYVSN